MKRFALAAGLLVALAPLASAQSDVQAWLDKMGKLSGKAFDTDMTFDISAEGMSMKGNGKLSFGDDTHYSMKMAMTVNAEAMGMENMEIKQSMTADGTTMWMEMEMEAMGMGKQIMKLPLSRMKDLSASGMGGGPMMNNDGTMNPLTSAQELTKIADLKIKSQEGGVVVIEGLLNEKGKEQFANPQMPLTVDRVTLTLNEKNAFPTQMVFGTESSAVVTMKTANTVWHKEVDLSKYSYTAPEGATVMDMSAFLPASDEEDDF